MIAWLKPIIKYMAQPYKPDIYGLWNNGYFYMGCIIPLFYELDIAGKYQDIILREHGLNTECRRIELTRVNLLTHYKIKPAIITVTDRRGTHHNPNEKNKNIEHILIAKNSLKSRS